MRRRGQGRTQRQPRCVEHNNTAGARCTKCSCSVYRRLLLSVPLLVCLSPRPSNMGGACLAAAILAASTASLLTAAAQASQLGFAPLDMGPLRTRASSGVPRSMHLPLLPAVAEEEDLAFGSPEYNWYAATQAYSRVQAAAAAPEETQGVLSGWRGEQGASALDFAAVRSGAGNPIVSLPGSGLWPVSGAYFATVGLGVPDPQPLNLSFTMLASSAWVACDLTNSTPPIGSVPAFKTQLSLSFTAIPCGGRLCNDLNNIVSNGSWVPCVPGTTCAFLEGTTTAQLTTGFAAVDTLTLTTTSQGIVAQGNVVFGCATQVLGQATQGFQNGAAGVLGFAAAADAVLLQLNSQFPLSAEFSFCLSGSDFYGSHIVLGAVTPPAPLHTIHLENSGSILYLLPLESLEVNGKIVVVSNLLTTVGVVLDAGTAYTLLPGQVIQAMVQELSGQTGLIFTPTDSLGFFCTEASNAVGTTFPPLQLNFGKNSPAWVVQPANYLLHTNLAFTNSSEPSGASLCVAVQSVPNLSPSVIGANWIADNFVTVNVEAGTVSWVPQNCSLLTQLNPNLNEGATLDSSHTSDVAPEAKAQAADVWPEAKGQVGPMSQAETKAFVDLWKRQAASAAANVTIACSRRSRPQLMAAPVRAVVREHSCTLTNRLSTVVKGIELSCSRFSPLNVGNINKDCSLPASVILNPGQTFQFAYQTASQRPAHFRVTNLELPHPAISTHTAPKQQHLRMACRTAAPTFVADNSFVYQYSCSILNEGKTAVTRVQLKCTNFQPLPNTAWNIDAGCTLKMASALAPAQQHTFGFQTKVPAVSFGVLSYQAM